MYILHKHYSLRSLTPIVTEAEIGVSHFYSILNYTNNLFNQVHERCIYNCIMLYYVVGFCLCRDSSGIVPIL